MSTTPRLKAGSPSLYFNEGGSFKSGFNSI